MIKTMIIYGSGASINELTFFDFYNLSQYESISFNWFCFSKKHTTYYLIREQANIPKRVNGEENVDNFIKIMNSPPYSHSQLLIQDISNHSPQAYNYADHLDRFNGDYLTIKDIKLPNNDNGMEQWEEGDCIKEVGLIHGKCTLNNVLHYTVWSRYKRIIFVGIDLYDSRYFWTEDTRYSVKAKGKNKDSKHSIANITLSLIKKMKEVYPEIELYTYNSKSLLRDIIPVWEMK